jgi:hypothetical protein
MNIGNYTAKRSEIDMRPFIYFPLDGFIYTLIFKLVGTDPVTKARTVPACLRAEIKIVKVRVKS